MLVFLGDAVSGGFLTSALALWPPGPQFIPWQLLTYAFVHAGVPHLAFNMAGGFLLIRFWRSWR